MRRGLWIILLLVLAGAGLALWRPWASSGATAFSGAHRGAAQSGPVPVAVATAKTADVPIYLDGLGTVQAYNSVAIHARVDGQLIQILFHQGQNVDQGDVLARIDPRTYQAALDQAVAKERQDQATLANARLDVARYAKLAAGAYASKQQYDTARATVAQDEAMVAGDQASVDNARTQLSFTTITAPITGRTGLRQVDQGNIVRTTDTTPITVVTQLQPISIVFTLPQQMLPAVAASMQGGMPAVIAVEHDDSAGIGARLKMIDRGKLTVLDNQVDPQTGTIKLKATFPNPKLSLWPGAFVNVRLLARTDKGVLIVPTAAVQRGPSGPYLYVVTKGDKAERRPLKLGYQDEQICVVESGVKAGDRVVTDGAQRLTDGKPVAVADASGLAPAAAFAQHPGAHTPRRGS